MIQYVSKKEHGNEQIRETKSKRKMNDDSGSWITAFRIFVEKKIEAVSMGEIAEAVGIGRATLFRCYSNKTDSWSQSVWHSGNHIWTSSIETDRFHRFRIFRRSIDSYSRWTVILKCIWIIKNCFSTMITLITTHAWGVDPEQFENIHTSVYSADTRLHMMYEKAKEDHTLRTDIPEDEFIRVTIHTMMAACTYYAGGFIWGAEDNRIICRSWYV